MKYLKKYPHKLTAIAHGDLKSARLRCIAEEATRKLDVADAYVDFDRDEELLHVPGHGAIYSSQNQRDCFLTVSRGQAHVARAFGIECTSGGQQEVCKK